MGGQVRKGEHGTPVVYWKITKPSERGDTDGEDEAGVGKRGSFFVRYYNVFNIAQVDGATLPADTAPELPVSERIAHAEAFIAALPGLDLRRRRDCLGLSNQGHVQAAQRIHESGQ